MKRIIMAACIVSLAACGGDKDDVATEQQQEWESQKQSLVYSFPDDNQQQVPVPSPVVLRFSSPVMETSPAVVLREVGGPVISEFETEWVDGKRGLIITPDSKLKPMTDYMVQIPAIELEKGMAPAKNIRFSTRALFEGPKSLVASDTFEVTRMIPDGENYAVMDFSSFRVQFSQPLDQTTVKYGDSADATVQLMGPEGLVDAHLLVSGHYMTVDPKDDLTPGMEYSLNMTTGITSTYGETLPGGSFGNPGDTLAVSVKVSPQDTKAPGTGLRVSMVQDVADTGELSPLTGMPINLVPMASVLLGEDTATQASGTIAAELAFVPNFPEATPFRVKRGSLIEGASIEVLIGGEVPAGFESGKVRMDFLSDATGYLLPNPYSNSDDAPRQVRLFMDVAVSTETPSANGAITQDLLHIELVGTSIVEEGHMVINAVGVVEPNVLEAERATGILSFFMRSVEDQDVEGNPTPIGEFRFISSTISEIEGLDVEEVKKSSDRKEKVKLLFNKPVEKEGLENRITLNGFPIEDFAKVDSYGTAIEIAPYNQWKDEFDGDFVSILIEGGLAAVDGSQLNNGVVLHINTGKFEIEKETIVAWPGRDLTNDMIAWSPMVLAAYPGFPCVLDESELDLSSGISGRCLGGNPGVSTGRPTKEADDLLPVMKLPSNRPIILAFSKEIDPDSVRLGETFLVSEVDDFGEEVSSISGSIEFKDRYFEFYPDSPWEEGKKYSYTIKSAGYEYFSSADQFSRRILSDSNYSCKDSTLEPAVCDIDGLPLQTQVLSNGKVVHLDNPAPLPSPDAQEWWVSWIMARNGNEPTAGGPDMTHYFVGTMASQNVIQVLFSAPDYDINSNLFIDADTKVVVLPEPSAPEHTKPGLVGLEYIIDNDEIPQGDWLDPLGAQGYIYEDIDPEPVAPSYNMVKILTRPTGKLPAMISDMNIGCGYEQPFNYYSPIRQVCPSKKFSHLKSVIIAEVTDEKNENGEIRVKIWPSLIVGTSMNLVPVLSLVPGTPFEELGSGAQMGATGPQFMRMRYKDTTQPIDAWISEINGAPILSTSIDLYVDAPYLSDLGTGFAKSSSNLTSYPINMSMEGAVNFLDDGRMSIAQYNTNNVEIGLIVAAASGQYMGQIDLIIPKEGARLNFISQ